MSARFRSALLVALIPSAAMAASTAATHFAEIGVQGTTDVSRDVLTTEKAWVLDPPALNPHRARWLVERDVKLAGLEGIPDGHGKFGVQVAGIVSHSKIYLRAPRGPWFLPFSEFPCTQQPDSWFSTYTGSLEASRAAAAEWEKTLDEGRLRLSVLLERIHADSASGAVARALVDFKLWLDERQLEWSVKGHLRARLAEWRLYLDAAVPQEVCRRTSDGKLTRVEGPVKAPSWETMMEPPSGPEPAKFLARAPARRWNDLLSVRVSMQFGKISLNGQFLVDSGSSFSVMSPGWLESQGIKPELLQLSEAPAQRIIWAGGTGVARRALGDDASVSGYPIALKSFLLMETELFIPPDFPSPCCDGILGADFLRQYAVQLLPGPPTEVVIWPRDGFRLDDKTPWTEIAATARGEVVSTGCDAISADGRKVEGTRWDTGSEVALDIHTPWQKYARAARGPWSLKCGSSRDTQGTLTVGRDIPLTYPTGLNDGAFLGARDPGLNVGMTLLGRGPIVFDLPHGRLWFDPAALKKTIPENRSGLELDFRFDSQQDRELVVSKIRAGTPAAELAKAGLRPGMKIEAMDSLAAIDMDIGEVERRLSGFYGKSVVLRWRTRRGDKIAPLNVAP